MQRDALDVYVQASSNKMSDRPVQTNAPLIQAQCDSVPVVARTDHTKRKSLYTALAAVPEQMLSGVVLNGHREMVVVAHVGLQLQARRLWPRSAS